MKKFGELNGQRDIMQREEHEVGVLHEVEHDAIGGLNLGRELAKHNGRLRPRTSYSYGKTQRLDDLSRKPASSDRQM